MRPAARSINRHSPVPLYRQIVELLLQDIRDNTEKTPDAPLPSETELTERYKVSRVTIRNALKELERMGVIYRAKGKGSFVTRPRLRGVSGFGSFTAEVSRQGRQPSSEVLDFKVVEALPLKMQEHFHLNADLLAGEQFVLLKRLRLIDDRPVAIEEAYLPQDMCPGLETIDFDSHRSLYSTLADYWGVVPVWAEALIESVAAAPDQAALLGIMTGHPLLVAWRIALTETDDVVEYVKSVYNGRDFLVNIGRHRIKR